MSMLKSKVKEEDLSPEEIKLHELNIDLKRVIGNNNEYLIGRILTIIDATTADETQRKAIKDLMRQVYSSNRLMGWDIIDSITIFFGKELGIKTTSFVHPKHDFKSLISNEKL